MPYLKKLTFAPLFLSLIITLIYLFKLTLDKYLEVFFGTWGGLYDLGLVALIIFFSSLTYCLYVTFTQNSKYYLGLAILSSLTPFIFLKPSLGLVACIGILISLSVAFFTLQANLKTYINFQPVNLLSAPIKTLNTLLLLALTTCFYFHSNSIIQTRGFKVPDQLIDGAINVSLQGIYVPVKGEKYLAQTPTLTSEQLELLKQNPQVLEQFGLDPSDVDQIVPNQNPSKIISPLPTASLKDTLKTQITSSLDQMIKPYLFLIPILLAFMFYSAVSFILWILSFFLSPIILFIFYVFEKTGFITFEKEMREVKKIVI